MTNEVDQILTEALEGAALKTRDIVNLNFTLHSTGDLIVHTFEDGKTSSSYRSSITIDGDTESQDAWLGGAYLTPQLTALKEHGKLPAYLKVIMDSTRKGNPYILVSAGDQPPVTAVNGTDTPVSQGGRTVQVVALEAFELKRLSTSDDVLAELLAGLDIEFAYTPEGHVTPSVAALTTAKALALKKALA